MRCYATPYTRTTLLITEEATFYKDCDPLLAPDPWCCPIILAWRFVYGTLIWLYVTSWESLPLYVQEDCQATWFNPNLSRTAHCLVRSAGIQVSLWDFSIGYYWYSVLYQSLHLRK